MLLKVPPIFTKFRVGKFILCSRNLANSKRETDDFQTFSETFVGRFL